MVVLIRHSLETNVAGALEPACVCIWNVTIDTSSIKCIYVVMYTSYYPKVQLVNCRDDYF